MAVSLLLSHSFSLPLPLPSSPSSLLSLSLLPLFQCVYRHSKQALSTETVCANWLRKQCTSEHCPMRHPSGKESSRKSNSNSGECCVPSIYILIMPMHCPHLWHSTVYIHGNNLGVPLPSSAEVYTMHVKGGVPSSHICSYYVLDSKLLGVYTRYIW